MIVCPSCGSDSSVTESRRHLKTIRRRRQCDKCRHRWNTYEVTLSFIQFGKELLDLITPIRGIADQLKLASEDYEIEDVVVPLSCPKCFSADIVHEVDDNYKRPRVRCKTCEFTASERYFRRSIK